MHGHRLPRTVLWTSMGLALLVFIGLFLLSPAAEAARFQGGERVVVGPGEVVNDDLYIAAGEVVIAGTVTGDVYATGQKIEVSGTIEGDLVALAQVIDITGSVGDDVRVAGQIIRVAGEGVGDDVLAGGYSVEVARGATVGGDVWVGAFQALIAGNVEGNVRANVNGLAIDGRVAGDVEANVGERGGPTPGMFMPSLGTPPPPVAPGLTVSDGAEIGGALTYTALQPARIASGARIAGPITKHEPAPEVRAPREEERFGSPQWVLAHARRLVTLLVVGLVLFLAAPDAMRRLGRNVQKRPLPALGWGVVGFIGFLMVLVGLVVVGVLASLFLGLLTLSTLGRWILVLGLLSDALLVVFFVFYTSLVGPVIVSYGTLGRLDTGRRWLWLIPLIFGVLLYVVLTAIPYLGSLVGLLVFLAGLGAIVLLWRPERPVPATLPATAPPSPPVGPPAPEVPQTSVAQAPPGYAEDTTVQEKPPETPVTEDESEEAVG